LLDWMFEQLRMVLRRGLDGEAARLWAQRFVAPPLSPQHPDASDPQLTAKELSQLSERIDDLTATIRRIEGNVAPLGAGPG
jgi:hypothetical protein